MRVSLGHCEGFPGTSVTSAIADEPEAAAPGIYYLDFRDENGVATSTSFFVDPLLEEWDEVVLRADSTRRLRYGQFTVGTLRLCFMPGRRPLVEGVHYSADPATGRVTLVDEFAPSDILVADYRHPGKSTGPWPSDARRAIPGVRLTFGHVLAGDRVAVLVERQT